VTGRFFLNLLGVPIHYERHIHSPEEIELLIIQGRDKGSLDDEEHRRLRRVLRFADRRVRELMVPRTRIKAVPRNASRTELMEALANSPYTRLPVYGASMDEIVGLVHVKDVAIRLASEADGLALDQILRSIPHVPLATPVDEVLEVMRRERAQMAIVLDEYGGTAGLVTMEDLVEEILGEVQDEFDREVPSFVRISEREAMVRGDLSLGDLQDQMGIEFEDDDVHTVGGLIMKLLGRPPVENDRVEHQGCAFIVEEVRGYRVQRVRVVRLDDKAEDAS
jgi:CBS domain containing-hemolysin-like protein